MIVCEHVSKVYGEGERQTAALQDLSLHIRGGEFVAVMGRSGSGKTTLLHIMGTLLKPTRGKVYLNGKELTELNRKEIQRIRRQDLGFVFQQYQLLPEYTAWQNICMPLTLDGRKADRDYLMELAELCDIREALDRYPDQMSGGQQQRVALMRALAAKPMVLLADEPTGNLDYQTGKDIVRVIRECQRRFSQTVVMVTHDSECASCADRIVFLKDGASIDKNKEGR